jgi:hypothetical protein
VLEAASLWMTVIQGGQGRPGYERPAASEDPDLRSREPGRIGRVAKKRDLEALERQDFWTLPEFSRLKFGRGPGWVYHRFTPDASGQHGTVRLPGGLEVPVDKDHNGWWMVSKYQYETAARRWVEES